MKTAISLPDDLFKSADALAGRLGVSRSQLYQEALAEYLVANPAADEAAENSTSARTAKQPTEHAAEATAATGVRHLRLVDGLRIDAGRKSLRFHAVDDVRQKRPGALLDGRFIDAELLRDGTDAARLVENRHEVHDARSL